MVSAILYSEIINSTTSLQDYLLEQQLMRQWERASAAVTPCGEISCILRQCAITKTTITNTTSFGTRAQGCPLCEGGQCSCTSPHFRNLITPIGPLFPSLYGGRANTPLSMSKSEWTTLENTSLQGQSLWVLNFENSHKFDKKYFDNFYFFVTHNLASCKLI